MKHVVVTDADNRVVGLVSMKDILALIFAAAPAASAGSGCGAESGRGLL